MAPKPEFEALRSRRVDFMQTLYSVIDDSFPDDVTAGKNFHTSEDRVSFVLNDTAIVKQGKSFTVTVCDRTYLVDSPDDYSVVKRNRWNTRIYTNGIRKIIPTVRNLGADSTQIERLEQGLNDLEKILSNTHPSTSELAHALKDGDVDMYESFTNPTLPEGRSELEGEFGDNNPPIGRNFVINTTNRRIEYTDEEITMVSGERDGTKQRASVVLGEDDGGGFIHPMPYSHLVNSDEYQITRDDIRMILGYNVDGFPDELKTDTIYRIQGDLVMGYVSPEEVEKNYIDTAIGVVVNNEIDLSDIIDDPSIRDRVNVETDTFSRDVQIDIYKPDWIEKPRFRKELEKILGDENPTAEIAERISEYVKDEFDVNKRASELKQEELGETEEAAIPIDNHLLLIPEAIGVGRGARTLRTRAIDLPDNTTIVYIPEKTELQIQHNEHDPINKKIPPGLYSFSLLNRAS